MANPAITNSGDSAWPTQPAPAAVTAEQAFNTSRQHRASITIATGCRHVGTLLVDEHALVCLNGQDILVRSVGTVDCRYGYRQSYEAQYLVEHELGTEERMKREQTLSGSKKRHHIDVVHVAAFVSLCCTCC